MIDAVKKRIRLVTIIALIVFLGVFGYYNFYHRENTKKRDTFIVKKGDLKEELIISGTIEAEEKVTLRFKTSGRISWIGVKEGDYVKKYQSIASLDQRELRKQLQKELNDYLNERWDFDQTKDENKSKLLTDSVKRVLEKAQFDLNNAVLDVEIQNLALEYASLWTPIEGIVTRVTSPYAGVYVSPTQAEFDIVNPATVYFSATADQTEVTKLYQGLVGNLVLDAYPDETLTGNIKNISFAPKSGETGTVYTVKFVFPSENASYKYRLGMAGDLSFVTREKKDVLYVPIKFIKEEKGKKYVEIKKDNKMEKLFVSVGMETDNEVEVVKGLTEGTIIYN